MKGQFNLILLSFFIIIFRFIWLSLFVPTQSHGNLFITNQRKIMVFEVLINLNDKLCLVSLSMSEKECLCSLFEQRFLLGIRIS